MGFEERVWRVLGGGFGMPSFAAILLLAAACGPSSDTGDHAVSGWQGTTVGEGSTLTVRTTGGSVWGCEGTLVEETAIGTESRGEQDLLGRVYGIDATSDRIFILDVDYTTVRVYDMAGNHVANIGRAGRGPGELRSPTAIGIDYARGLLLVRESVGSALHRFTISGGYINTLPPSMRGGLSGSELLLRVTRDGLAVLPGHSLSEAFLTGRRTAWMNVLYTVDSTGAVTDSIRVPYSDNEEFMLKAQAGREAYRPEPVPFGPQDVWSIGFDGALIAGYAAEYRFEICYADGRRTVIEREDEPVSVLPDERDSADRRVRELMRHFEPGWNWNGPDIPATKPWYAAIFPDRTGRLWVLRHGEGRSVEGWTEPRNWRGWDRYPEWTSESWFDVFEEETGRYLGRVDVPEGFLAEPEPFIAGDTFICLTEDDVGRHVVRRYRLRRVR